MTHALFIALALAAGDGTIEQGKVLFSDPTLGTTGKSCKSCHMGGDALDPDVLGAASAKDLGILSNHCLRLRMKGVKLDPESEGLRSLVQYVRTFRSKHR